MRLITLDTIIVRHKEIGRILVRVTDKCGTDTFLAALAGVSIVFPNAKLKYSVSSTRFVLRGEDADGYAEFFEVIPEDCQLFETSNVYKHLPKQGAVTATFHELLSGAFDRTMADEEFNRLTVNVSVDCDDTESARGKVASFLLHRSY